VLSILLSIFDHVRKCMPLPSPLPKTAYHFIVYLKLCAEMYAVTWFPTYKQLTIFLSIFDYVRKCMLLIRFRGVGGKSAAPAGLLQPTGPPTRLKAYISAVSHD
jgi:hypothetical protein